MAGILTAVAAVAVAEMWVLPEIVEVALFVLSGPGLHVNFLQLM